jgi:hypothetical protein
VAKRFGGLFTNLSFSHLMYGVFLVYIEFTTLFLLKYNRMWMHASQIITVFIGNHLASDFDEFVLPRPLN